MSLTWRMFWRDFRGGELTLLLVSLVLAVTVVTSISIFAERIRSTILTEAGSLLAADYALQGSREMPPSWFAIADELGLEQARIVSFSSMLFGEGTNRLGSVRAVTDGYPLKGSLQVSNLPFGPAVTVSQGPPPGEIWLASRLFPLLEVEVGDMVGIGATDLRVGRVLISEPDQAASLFNVEPRAMINMADLEATGAIQPGSRVTYRWLLAGPNLAHTELRNAIRSEREPHFQWRSARRANENVGEALDRAEGFLLLSGSLAVILAGVALAMSAQRYAARHVDGVALMKTVGFTPQQIIRLYGLGLTALAVVGIAAGLLLGELTHQAIIWLLGDLLPSNLAMHDWRSYGMGALTGFVALMGFAWPPFYRLRDVPPVKVIRSEVFQQPKLLWQLWGALGIMLIVLVYSGDWQLTLVMVAGGAVCIWGAGLFARGLLWLLRRYGSELGRNWRLGLASLQRRSQQNGLQVVIFAIALMLLFTLVLIRTSLLAEWQQQLPEDAPNHFVYNVFDEDLDSLNDWIDEQASNRSPAYPVTRGRMTLVNDESVDDLSRDLPDRNNYRRELNMTWSAELGADNQVVAGDWWDNYGEGELKVSVEEDFARNIGIEIGDTLYYSVGGIEVSAEVASLRSLNWESFNPNFYMIFNQPLEAGAGAFYLVSFYLAPDDKPALNDLVRTIPTLAVLEVDTVIEQVQGIIRNVTLAIEFILVLILISGLLVLIAGIQSSLDVRFRESALLRTMGAPAGLLRGTLWIEFGALGALAGLLGAMGTEGILFYLQGSLFDMETRWHPTLWLAAPLVGGALIGSVGVLSTRKVIYTPPMQVLRNWI
ncbi:FtsX-like permease family protein [Natronospirillum operosum]|uniref:FtsX-like permease family protein n=1 Tax=Natronospirillum operosum TaxID=2759953 RepID=A0A4Z0WF51_9GAMM|nr:FtsX-like permease family protein [Natronospirillum operosum]TGG92956.1 FtsX-like permease family protein [Natronospirillum operosum]